MTAGRVATAALLLAFALAACSGGDNPRAASPVQVVATTTVLADLVAGVGGDRVAVTSIVPRGGEVHTFDPTPRDVSRLSDADLIVANGVGLDDWLAAMATEAGARAGVVRLGEGLPDDAYIVDPEGGGPNPHLWLDPELATRFVEQIETALADVDPAGAASYHSAAARTRSDLASLDAWAAGRFAAVPPADRRIVSFHDALPYLARAYGIEIVGVVVDSPGQEPSAGEVAALIDEIRRTGVKAIVSEAAFDDRVARSIAEESGATIVSDLYTDSLGDPPVDTYEGLVRWDVERIAAALESP